MYALLLYKYACLDTLQACERAREREREEGQYKCGESGRAQVKAHEAYETAPDRKPAQLVPFLPPVPGPDRAGKDHGEARGRETVAPQHHLEVEG